jgi:hypothetical protein
VCAGVLVVGLLLSLAIGACARRTRPVALKTVFPPRASCPAKNETASSEFPVEVRVVLLCEDDFYGDFGFSETRFVGQSVRSPIELAVREVLECCPNRAEDLTGVTVDRGVATLNFPAGYQNTEDWNNVSTAGGNRAFFPPLVETIFQFAEVQQIATSFGGVGWWPIESEYGPITRDSFRVPLGPLPIEPTSDVAAINHVANALRSEFGDQDWYDEIRTVTATVQNLRIETNLGPLDQSEAEAIAEAVNEILDRSRARWCYVGVELIATSGETFEVPPGSPRCKAAIGPDHPT